VEDFEICCHLSYNAARHKESELAGQVFKYPFFYFFIFLFFNFFLGINSWVGPRSISILEKCTIFIFSFS